MSLSASEFLTSGHFRLRVKTRLKKTAAKSVPKASETNGER